jgi:structure-specific recognition protein 1
MNLQFATTGAHYGKTVVGDNVLTFKGTGDKVLFDFKLENVAQCVLPQNNRNEVEIQFQEPDNAPADEDSLVQITFRFSNPKAAKKAVPEDADGEKENEEEDVSDQETEAEVFHRTVMDTGAIKTIVSNVIVEFTKDQGTFVTPRGRYTIQMTSNYLRMQGAQYDYKIMYQDINSLFLLPKPDGARMAFVISLSKPIRQGNQKYQHLVLETHKLEETITINLTEEEIATKYDGQLTTEMRMPMCNAVAKIFKVLTQNTVSGSVLLIVYDIE